mgnify:CR=1 FL=1
MVKGSHYAPEVLARIVAVRYGNTVPGYFTIHKRLRAQVGPATARACVDCGNAAQHWSLRPSIPEEHIHQQAARRDPTKTLLFSRTLSDYEPRCVRCHVHLDGNIAAGNPKKTHCRHGHPYNPENTIVARNTRTPSGVARECRTCRTAQSLARPRSHRKKVETWPA